MIQNSTCPTIEIVIDCDDDPDQTQAICDDIDRLFWSLLFAGAVL